MLGTLNFFFDVIPKDPSGRLAGMPVNCSTLCSILTSSEMPKDPAGRSSPDGIFVIRLAAFIRLVSACSLPAAEIPKDPSGKLDGIPVDSIP